MEDRLLITEKMIACEAERILGSILGRVMPQGVVHCRIYHERVSLMLPLSDRTFIVPRESFELSLDVFVHRYLYVEVLRLAKDHPEWVRGHVVPGPESDAASWGLRDLDVVHDPVVGIVEHRGEVIVATARGVFRLVGDVLRPIPFAAAPPA